MATPAKTSYHDNVAVFQEIISFCVAMGPKYNPSSKDLQLTNLQAVVGEATECLSKLDKAIVATEDTATERKEAFQKLKKIITPLRNAINASDLPPLAVTDLLDLLNAVAGYGASVELTSEEKTKLMAEGKKPSKKKKIKATFADRIADLNKMLTRMETTEGYAPNEEHLSIKGLRALHTLLHTAQNAAVTAKESEDNQRIERNKCFHDDSGNLLDTGERTRNYLKSVYPPGTPEYKKIVGFKFKPNKYNR